MESGVYPDRPGGNLAQYECRPLLRLHVLSREHEDLGPDHDWSRFRSVDELIASGQDSRCRQSRFGRRKRSRRSISRSKFDLQRRVLEAYLDLALTEELIRIERDNLTFLKLLSDSASDRAEAGGPMQDLFKALIESETAQNDLAGLEAKAQSMRGELNGMLGRDASAPLGLPPELPPPRPVTADDAALIAVAVSQNPELAALAQQVAGRSDAAELARLAYLPDIIPSASITGSVSQSLGAMLMVPTKLPAIRAAIDEAAAMTRSAEAMLRQTQRDRAARFVADLYLMRNAERETELYRARVVPAARQLVSSSRNAYAAGTIVFADLIDSERMFISVRRMVAQAQIEREQRLAELEALAGVDIETLGRQANAETPPAAHTARAE